MPSASRIGARIFLKSIDEFDANPSLGEKESSRDLEHWKCSKSLGFFLPLPDFMGTLGSAPAGAEVGVGKQEVAWYKLVIKGYSWFPTELWN